jgi:hypothetical protein
VGQWWDEILDEVESDGVDVSPRFGQYARTDAANVQGSLDVLLGIVAPAAPNWLEGAADATPEPTATP